MTAGAGIVHSERTGPDVRRTPSRIFGVQSWLAQPKSHENGPPAFSHTNLSALPLFEDDGVSGRLILGEFLGQRSPVATQWPTLYLDLGMQPESKVVIPRTTEERAIYTFGGVIEIGGARYDPQQMMVLRPGDDVTVYAHGDVRLIILGGAVMGWAALHLLELRVVLEGATDPGQSGLEGATISKRAGRRRRVYPAAVCGAP